MKRSNHESGIQAAMTAAEFRALGKPSRNKYGAKKTIVDGIRFDSKAEAAYYARLEQRRLADEVAGVERQRAFDLLVNGVSVGVYKADFAFFDVTADRFRVIDVKGAPPTRDFILKKKLMKAIYGIDVEIAK